MGAFFMVTVAECLFVRKCWVFVILNELIIRVWWQSSSALVFVSCSVQTYVICVYYLIFNKTVVKVLLNVSVTIQEGF